MNQKGQSYIEVLIATVILGIVVVGLLHGVVAGILGTRSVDMRTTAVNIARSQMEYIKAQPYDYTPPYYNVLPLDELPQGWSPSQIGIVATPVDGSQYLQLITVTVSYGDGQSFTLEGYRSNR